MTDYKFLQSYKSAAFHPIKYNSYFTTCARKSKKRCAEVSVGHKMFAQLQDDSSEKSNDRTLVHKFGIFAHK